jgi:hypothetical protein
MVSISLDSYDDFQDEGKTLRAPNKLYVRAFSTAGSDPLTLLLLKGEYVRYVFSLGYIVGLRMGRNSDVDMAAVPPVL